MKTAVLATGRPGVIAFEGGYHGLSYGALSVTARADFRAPFASVLPPQAHRIAFPRAAGHDVFERIDAIVAESAKERPIGALIVEPIQGRAGTVVPPLGFLAGLRAACDRNEIMLIVDEIFTGCGRTGAMLESVAQGVLPDLVCLGKALGGGFPVSVCLGRPEVMAAWGESTGEALHTSTFLGHPVASAAALENLALIDDEGLLSAAAHKGARLSAALRTALSGADGVVEVRGRGLMWGIELTERAGRSAGDRAWQAVLAALGKGVLLLPAGERGEVIQLTPPATITEAQLDLLASVTIESVRAS